MSSLDHKNPHKNASGSPLTQPSLSSNACQPLTGILLTTRPGVDCVPFNKSGDPRAA